MVVDKKKVVHNGILVEIYVNYKMIHVLIFSQLNIAHTH